MEAVFCDAHLHLQDKRFKTYLDTVISDALEKNVTRLVCNGTSENDWQEVGELNKKYPNHIIPFYGLHPWYVEQAGENWEDALRQILLNNKQAGVGECGLDRSKRFVNDTSQLQLQEKAFCAQIKLAQELKRPCAVHCVHSWEWLFSIFESLPPTTIMIMHAFSGSTEIAKRLAQNKNIYFSCGANSIFQESHYKMLKALPLDKILSETDSPDLAPEKCEVNLPSNIPSFVQRLAEVRGVDVNQLAGVIQENFARIFAV